jgi:type II secretory pathway pseudopilin PulG
MNCTKAAFSFRTSPPNLPDREEGFSLVEFLIASMILLAVAAWIFSMLAEIQQEASYQNEVLSVISNTQSAMQTVERFLRQAGNDPLASGLHGITIISASEIQIHADIKGSAGTSNPDKGDPDGDFNDSDEAVVIRYNAKSRSIEVVPEGGPAQIIANFISNLSFQYYNKDGAMTMEDGKVSKIGITISGSSMVPHPRTRQYFGIQLRSEIRKIT